MFSVPNAISVAYVLHSELLGARSSSICDDFVLMRKNEFLSAASWRTKVSASMLMMGLTGLLFTDKGVCKFFKKYLSSLNRKARNLNQLEGVFQLNLNLPAWLAILSYYQTEDREAERLDSS